MFALSFYLFHLITSIQFPELAYPILLIGDILIFTGVIGFGIEHRKRLINKLMQLARGTIRYD